MIAWLCWIAASCAELRSHFVDVRAGDLRLAGARLAVALVDEVFLVVAIFFAFDQWLIADSVLFASKQGARLTVNRCYELVLVKQELFDVKKRYETIPRLG